jgi:hypothetical protein
MLRALILSLSLIVLTGCAAVSNLLPSGWDDNEMMMIVELQYDIRRIQCPADVAPDEDYVTTPEVWHSIDNVWATKEKLWYYAQATRHVDVIELVRPFSASMEGLYYQAREGKLRRPYCVNKVIILTKQADAMAEALATRNK